MPRKKPKLEFQIRDLIPIPPEKRRQAYLVDLSLLKVLIHDNRRALDIARSPHVLRSLQQTKEQLEGQMEMLQEHWTQVSGEPPVPVDDMELWRHNRQAIF